MTESTEKLLTQLEQATGAVPLESLDEETAKLQESWIALSSLLEAANEKTATSCQPATKPPGLRTALRFFIALAAVLVCAVTAWTVLWQPMEPDGSLRPASELIAESAATPSVPLESGIVSVEVAESPPIQDELAWDDSFDEQLAATSQSIRSVQSDWSGSDRHYSVLIDQFEEFSDELIEGSL